jgi:GNAT superfamily N-acetyltransferase
MTIVPVTVRAVASPEDFQAFLAFASKLHRDDPCWIPMPPEIYARLLSREENPYFEHADAELFLAERDGEIVGQIIGHVDHRLNEFQHNEWGLFGLFEAEDDQIVADALIEAAAQWLSERGRNRMVGPLLFSTNEDFGLLVEGNDRRPVALQQWHPPYYRELLERAGFSKEVDMVWRELEMDQIPDELLAHTSRWAALVKTRFGVTIREPYEDDVEADLERVFRFMAPIFESHWGSVPKTENELVDGLEMSARFVGPGTLIAERDGELIGASMLMPDFHQHLVREGGEVIWSEKKIDQARLMFMAVEPAYRHIGITPALCHEHLEMARREGIERFVIGSSLEDNQQMNAMAARLGLEVARRQRVFAKELS